MKRRICILILAALCSGLILPAKAQDGYRELDGKLMPFIVEEGDTVYLSPLAAARVYEKKKRKKGSKWRKYYRLVHNFAKVYPYALVAKDLIREADSTIRADNLKYVKKELFVDDIIKELFTAFEQPMRTLTVSQGQLLMKLIDRECGITSYTIIRNFTNKYAAGFWQGIAKMFGSDLKKPYDPTGEDAPTEELVRQWENGSFEQTYYEIFWKYPPIVEIPDNFQRPNLKTMNAVREEELSAEQAKKKGSKRQKTVTAIRKLYGVD